MPHNPNSTTLTGDITGLTQLDYFYITSRDTYSMDGGNHFYNNTKERAKQIMKELDENPELLEELTVELRKKKLKKLKDNAKINL